MPVSKRLAGVLRPTLFATRASRFRVAVSLGFVIASVGATSLFTSGQSGFAQGWIGPSDMFGGFFQPFEQPERPDYRRRSHVRRSHEDREKHQARAHHAPHAAPLARQAHVAKQTPGKQTAHPRLARQRDVKPILVVKLERPQGMPMVLHRQSICVRQCDGFFFPVGTYNGDGDRASHEATCRSECPGAQTALYVLPVGADSINEAYAVRSGQNYSALPKAFHYTTLMAESCSCHAKAGSRVASLLRDFTLRRGDAVLTSHGFQVFHGASHYPFKSKDFVALARSRDVRRSDLAVFHAIEKASIGSPSNVASVERDVEPAQPQHQASR